jgi:hypothetical protein
MARVLNSRFASAASDHARQPSPVAPDPLAKAATIARIPLENRASALAMKASSGSLGRAVPRVRPMQAAATGGAPWLRAVAAGDHGGDSDSEGDQNEQDSHPGNVRPPCVRALPSDERARGLVGGLAVPRVAELDLAVAGHRPKALMAVRGVEESRGDNVVRDAPKDAWGCAFCRHALALPREHDVNVPSCLTAHRPARGACGNNRKQRGQTDRPPHCAEATPTRPIARPGPVWAPHALVGACVAPARWEAF